jgi:hypothetical protein
MAGLTIGKFAAAEGVGVETVRDGDDCVALHLRGDDVGGAAARAGTR